MCWPDMLLVLGPAMGLWQEFRGKLVYPARASLPELHPQFVRSKRKVMS
jgi:hypothetical protein